MRKYKMRKQKKKKMCSGRFGAQVLPVKSWLSLLAEVTQIKPDSGGGGAPGRTGGIDADTAGDRERGRVKEPQETRKDGRSGERRRASQKRLKQEKRGPRATAWLTRSASLSS